jgi:dTDP-4-amino-4,6-dideoxygalactose transaminase
MMPANICPIIPAIFLKARQNFEFIDISPNTLMMDESKTLEKVKFDPNLYAGILYVHSYGNEFFPKSFFQELKNIHPSLTIIDDRCLCFPSFAEPDLEYVDLIIYSTGYAKPVDIGSGGYGWINEIFQYRPSLLEYSIDSLKLIDQNLKTALSQKTQFHYQVDDWLNGSPFEITVKEYKTIVQSELKMVQPLKNQINKIYSEGLPSEIQFSSEFQKWRFNIKTTQKDEILKQLFSAGLFASSLYHSLGGIMGNGDFPHAKRLYQHIINLFNDRYYTEEKAHRTVEFINSVLKRA